MKNISSKQFALRGIVGVVLIISGIALAFALPKDGSISNNYFTLGKIMAFAIEAAGMPFIISWYKQIDFGAMNFKLIALSLVLMSIIIFGSMQ